MSDVRENRNKRQLWQCISRTRRRAQRSGCSGCRPGSGYKGQVYLRKHFRSATLTAVLQSVT